MEIKTGTEGSGQRTTLDAAEVEGQGSGESEGSADGGNAGSTPRGLLSSQLATISRAERMVPAVVLQKWSASGTT